MCMSRSNARAVLEPVTEDYSTLRINVDFIGSQIGHEVKSLAILSAKRGEGRTATAVYLGMAYAKAGKKTIVVDADLRNPGVHRFIGEEPSPGLSDLLASGGQTSEMIRQSPYGRLSILPSGPVPGNPSELLASPRMQETLEELKQRFDIVIVDCPPLSFIETKILASNADGAILVLEYGKINRDTAQKTKEELDQIKVNLLGTVLNKSKP